MTTPFMTTLADCVLLAQLPPYEPLRRKLERAVVVASEAVPADVATMNSRVRYTDGAQQRVARLAYPASAGGPGLLSVLTPVGAALLAENRGPESVFIVAGAITVVLTLAALLLPSIRELE